MYQLVLFIKQKKMGKNSFLRLEKRKNPPLGKKKGICRSIKSQKSDLTFLSACREKIEEEQEEERPIKMADAGMVFFLCPKKREGFLSGTRSRGKPFRIKYPSVVVILRSYFSNFSPLVFSTHTFGLSHVFLSQVSASLVVQ